MRRLTFLLAAVMLFSACRSKTVRVPVPGSAPVAIPASELEGIASYYAEPYHGRQTASGEVFDTYNGMTAAHRTLPFNTVVVVRNTTNGREVQVRINDRGPFINGRIIDLSLAAAREIDMVRAGIVPVKLKIVEAGAPSRTAFSGTGLYAVQVGAFENRDAAEKLKLQMERDYADVTIQTVSGERILYRVHVGREADLLSAEILAAELRRQADDAFVVRLN